MRIVIKRVVHFSYSLVVYDRLHNDDIYPDSNSVVCHDIFRRISRIIMLSIL